MFVLFFGIILRIIHYHNYLVITLSISNIKLIVLLFTVLDANNKGTNLFSIDLN